MVDINTIKLKYATFFADSSRQKKKNFYIGYTKTPSAIWNCPLIFLYACNVVVDGYI